MGNNTIDCARMSHLACLEPPPEPDFESAGEDAYECVSDCLSSLGPVGMVNGAIVALGCAVIPPACAIFAVASATSIVGGCAVACDELAEPPVNGP